MMLPETPLPKPLRAPCLNRLRRFGGHGRRMPASYTGLFGFEQFDLTNRKYVYRNVTPIFGALKP